MQHLTTASLMAWAGQKIAQGNSQQSVMHAVQKLLPFVKQAENEQRDMATEYYRTQTIALREQNQQNLEAMRAFKREQAIRDEARKDQRLTNYQLRFLPTSTDAISRAAAIGFQPPDLVNEAKIWSTTGDFSEAVKSIRGTDRNNVETAIRDAAKQNNIEAPTSTTKAEYAAKQGAIKKWADPATTLGQTRRSLSAILEHARTGRQLVDSWNPSENRFVNKIGAWISEQLGGTAPTNLDTFGQIFGTELLRALGVRGAGGVAEREELAQRYGASAPAARGLYDLGRQLLQNSGGTTPDQAYGAIETAESLVMGQLNSMRADFVATTGLPADKFDASLTEIARDEIKRIHSGQSLPASHQFPGFGLGGMELNLNRNRSYQGPQE